MIRLYIERVKQRIKLGGHGVPEGKIEKRYSESLELLPEVIQVCYRVFLFDNSSEERNIEPVAEIDSSGKLIVRSEKLPWWVQDYVIKKLYS